MRGRHSLIGMEPSVGEDKVIAKCGINVLGFELTGAWAQRCRATVVAYSLQSVVAMWVD